jgi:hypothetical protein
MTTTMIIYNNTKYPIIVDGWVFVPNTNKGLSTLKSTICLENSITEITSTTAEWNIHRYFTNPELYNKWVILDDDIPHDIGKFRSTSCPWIKNKYAWFNTTYFTAEYDTTLNALYFDENINIITLK